MHPPPKSRIQTRILPARGFHARRITRPVSKFLPGAGSVIVDIKEGLCNYNEEVIPLRSTRHGPATEI